MIEDEDDDKSLLTGSMYGIMMHVCGEGGLWCRIVAGYVPARNLEETSLAVAGLLHSSMYDLLHFSMYESTTRL